MQEEEKAMQDVEGNKLQIGDEVWAVRQGILIKAVVVKPNTKYPYILVRYEDGYGKYVLNESVIKRK